MAGPKMVPFIKMVSVYFILDAYKHHGQYWTTLLKCAPIVCLMIFIILCGTKFTHKYEAVKSILAELLLIFFHYRFVESRIRTKFCWDWYFRVSEMRCSVTITLQREWRHLQLLKYSTYWLLDFDRWNYGSGCFCMLVARPVSPFQIDLKFL